MTSDRQRSRSLSRGCTRALYPSVGVFKKATTAFSSRSVNWRLPSCLLFRLVESSGDSGVAVTGSSWVGAVA